MFVCLCVDCCCLASILSLSLFMSLSHPPVGSFRHDISVLTIKLEGEPDNQSFSLLS